MANIAPLWADMGIAVTVLYPRCGALWDRFADSGVQLLEFEMKGKYDLGAVRRLSAAISDSQAQVIHSQGAAALDLMTVAAAQRTGVSSVITRPVMIEDLINRPALSRKLFEVVDRIYTLKRADALVAVSQDGFKRLEKFARNERLHLIHNGTSSPVDNLPPRPDDGKLHVGMVGHLRDYKAFDDFLRVAQKLCNMRENLHFDIVGEGPERASLEAVAAEWRMEGNVTFHGLLTDVGPALQQMDIFLFTSLREGLSVAILEAMSAGLPIIATDIGGVADQVEPGQNGAILPARDIDGLAAACIELIDDTEKRAVMGRASRRKFEAHFAQGAMLKNYVRLYDGVAAKKRRV
jgi:glycosyltransferase involved in cell wall biosynthesis